MAENNFLIAIATLERVEPLLNADKRDQIDKVTLMSVQKYIDMAILNLNNVKLKNEMSILYLADVCNLIEVLLDEEGCVTTDTDTKLMIASKVNNCLDDLYIEAGMYYDTEHEFDYSRGLDPLLQRIVMRCIRSGYYFGYKKGGEK